MRFIFLSVLVLAFSASAFAKKDEKQVLIDKMVTNCKAELGKEPALAETKDAETVWRNLEDKEHSKVALSKQCHTAHEAYEHKYHKDEAEEGEHKE